jgi:hypothetical protein
MQRFIVIDLIKYIISDYVSVPVLTTINPIWINKNRINTIYKSINNNTSKDIIHIKYTDNIITKKYY